MCDAGGSQSMHPGPTPVAPGNLQILGLLNLLHQKPWGWGPPICGQSLQVFLVPKLQGTPMPSIWGSSNREVIRPPFGQVILKKSSSGSHLYWHIIWIQPHSLRLDSLISKLVESFIMLNRAYKGGPLWLSGTQKLGQVGKANSRTPHFCLSWRTEPKKTCLRTIWFNLLGLYSESYRSTMRDSNNIKSGVMKLI